MVIDTHGLGGHLPNRNGSGVLGRKRERKRVLRARRRWRESRSAAPASNGSVMGLYHFGETLSRRKSPFPSVKYGRSFKIENV